MEPLIKNCPFHDLISLETLEIQLPQGAIRKCKECGLEVSSCDGQQFHDSLSDRWDIAGEVDPSPKSLRRLRSRRRADWRTITRLSRFKKGKVHLDVGCATGTSVEIFETFGFKSYGIDPSSQPVNLGVEAGRKLQVGFLEEARFESESFDVVTMYEVIEHVPDPTILLTEISRILKPGGVLVVGTGNTDSWTRKIRREKWDFFDLHKNGGHVCFYSPKVLRTIGPRFGLKLKWSNTYSVKFAERSEVSPIIYRILKLGSELLSLPSKLLRKGHQMECFLVKK